MEEIIKYLEENEEETVQILKYRNDLNTALNEYSNGIRKVFFIELKNKLIQKIQTDRALNLITEYPIVCTYKKFEIEIVLMSSCNYEIKQLHPESLILVQVGTSSLMVEIMMSLKEKPMEGKERV